MRVDSYGMTKYVMSQYQLDVLTQRALMACCQAHEAGFQRFRNANLWELADALFHLCGLSVLIAKDAPVHIRAQVFAADLTCREIFNSQAMFCWNTPVSRRPKVNRLVRNTDVLGQLLNATGQLDGGMYVFHSSILHM